MLRIDIIRFSSRCFKNIKYEIKKLNKFINIEIKNIINRHNIQY